MARYRATEWSLLDLLARGSIGPVAHGVSSDTVVEAFGAPGDMSRGRPPIILKYGALEVTVSDERTELLRPSRPTPSAPSECARADRRCPRPAQQATRSRPLSRR